MPEIINFTKEEGLKMFDALSRTNSARQIKPLDQSDYITYNHRYYYDEYNLCIGDVFIMVPPEFIYVSSESYSQKVQTLRQENSQKRKTGYHKRTIQIDLVFNGMDEINGYKVPAPAHPDGTYIDENGNKKDRISNYYYVDGLRTLLAEFKLTPFLPISNDLLNNAYKIYTVALQSIVIETIDGFQNALKAHITLQEVDMVPYIEMPNIMFKHTIDWDLFRYYTQSILTEHHIYKKLQSMPVNRDHTKFKLSILNESVLQMSTADSNGKVTSKTAYDTYAESKEEYLLKKIINPDNYSTILDSNESDVHISAFQFTYANLLTSIQMADSSVPTLQYLGGLDTQFGITFETTDVSVIGSIEQCQIQNDLMIRNNPKIKGSIGFVKIESDFVTFCGSLFCTIESVETYTVQGIPGLYQVRLLCVSYDIAQSRRESLNGFFPFEGQESTVADLELSGNELESKFSKNLEQCIDQSYSGLMKKIYQDNYAEWKLRTSMEVYPDLVLPTYKEVDQAIANINAFRKSNNKDQLPYDKYPVQPTNILFGNGEQTNSYPNHWIDNGGSNYYENGINNQILKEREYDIYVDPDFYVFYPNTYMSLYLEEEEYNNQVEQSTGKKSDPIYSDVKQFTSKSGEVKTIFEPIYDDEEDTDSKIRKFITNLNSLKGCHYAPFAEGETKDYAGPMFDELGLITYVLKDMGIIPNNFQRLSHSDLNSLDIFEQVSINDIKTGDIVVDSGKGNYIVCTGIDKTGNLSGITSTESKGVTEMQIFFQPAYVYRILPLQRNYNKQGTSQSNPYPGDENQYPDENGEILAKKATTLETTEGYESDNPFGDDENKAYENQSFTQSNTTTTINNTTGGATVNQDLGVWAPISEKDLNDYINAHAPKDSPFRGKANIFIRAAQESGLDPRYILAHAIHETGWGKSNIAKKKNNYFGIGAFDASPYASAYSYDGMAAGIIEGAKWISNNYYNGKYGQKTLSKMRFNDNVHQYATDPEWANKIAKFMDAMPKNASAQYDDNQSSVNTTGSSTTTTIDNSEQIKLKEKERRNRNQNANALEEATKPIELQQASISELSLPTVLDDGSNWTDGSVVITEYKDMTLDEFDSLSLLVASECEGENMACKMAMAQLLYDIAQTKYKGYGLTKLLHSELFIQDKTSPQQKDKDEAKTCVQRVFQAGVRWRKDYKVLGFTSFENSNYANETDKSKYDFIGSVNQHNFYGSKNEDNEVIGYNIKDYGVSKASSNTVTIVRKYEVKANTFNDNSFGKPIYIKCSHFDTHSYSVGEEWQDLNKDRNRITTSFVDDCQYSAKGRLVKAFPAFLFCILDDQAQWYDGRKLWTNYYVYKPVVSIDYHAANDMPTETLQIMVTNTYHNLDRASAALVNYSVSKDTDYSNFNKWLWKNTGMIAGGLKITNRLVQLHSILFNHTKVREGARVHLRIGYGSDPLSLAPIINGTVSGISLGDQINILVTSDGHELIQNVTSEKTKDINNGALGLFGLGATQEASNIISQILVKRESWMNHLFFGKKWFEGSKYNIEHFGLYINKGDIKMYGGLAGGIDTGIYEQYDLLMNIYRASTDDGWIQSYRHQNYMYNTRISGLDHESNIVFNKYNMTPWDVFQLCAQTMPEFITKPEMYQFDSRLFYGLPFELTKYRYDIINGTIYQECKSNTQMHYIDSTTSIIENQVSVTSRNHYTNAKVIYTLGKTPKSTAVIHSDDTIDHSKQSTRIIDSCITQNYLLWDQAWETLGLSKQGKNCARKLGISNLLYGWEQQYQGQLLCLGSPQVRPHDYLMVNDFYANLNGLCTVREVIHSFSTTTGFTTSIVPGIIGFCPEQDSGGTIMIANFLRLFSQFTEYTISRKQLLDNAQRYAELIADLDRAINAERIANFKLNVWKAGDALAGTIKTANLGILMYRTVRACKNVGGIIKFSKILIQTVKVSHEAYKVFQSTRTVLNVLTVISHLAKATETAGKIIAEVETGALAVSTIGGPVTFVVVLVISIIADILLDSLVTWIENRNTIVLLPLWWEGEPFISSIKDGEKILLIPNSYSATGENTGENGIETDEDEIALND